MSVRDRLRRLDRTALRNLGSTSRYGGYMAPGIDRDIDALRAQINDLQERVAQLEAAQRG